MHTIFVILQQNLASISEQDQNTENQLEKAQNLLGDSSDFYPPVLWSYDCTLGPRKLKTLKNGKRVWGLLFDINIGGLENSVTYTSVDSACKK